MFRLYPGQGLVNGRNPGALNPQPGSFCLSDTEDEEEEYSFIKDLNQKMVCDPSLNTNHNNNHELSTESTHPKNLKEEDNKEEKDKEEEEKMNNNNLSVCRNGYSPMHRPYFLTLNQTTQKYEILVWPGIAHAGIDADKADVPEWVEDQTEVIYPGIDGSKLSKKFRSTWTAYLDRRYFPRTDWPYTKMDVSGCNRYSTSVKTPKLLLIDRHWGRLVWAKVLKMNGRLSGEKFTVQIQRPWAKNRATLTVGAKVGFNPRTDRRNHNSLGCHVCDVESHIKDISPCIMIIVDALASEITVNQSTPEKTEPLTMISPSPCWISDPSVKPETPPSYSCVNRSSYVTKRKLNEVSECMEINADLTHTDIKRRKITNDDDNKYPLNMDDICTDYNSTIKDDSDEDWNNYTSPDDWNIFG